MKGVPSRHEGQSARGPYHLGQAWCDLGQDLYRRAYVAVDRRDPDAEAGGELGVGISDGLRRRECRRLNPSEALRVTPLRCLSSFVTEHRWLVSVTMAGVFLCHPTQMFDNESSRLNRRRRRQPTLTGIPRQVSGARTASGR